MKCVLIFLLSFYQHPPLILMSFLLLSFFHAFSAYSSIISSSTFVTIVLLTQLVYKTAKCIAFTFVITVRGNVRFDCEIHVIRCIILMAVTITQSCLVTQLPQSRNNINKARPCLCYFCKQPVFHILFPARVKRQLRARCSSWLVRCSFVIPSRDGRMCAWSRAFVYSASILIYRSRCSPY